MVTPIRRAEGYTLVALAIVAVVLSVMVAAVLPTVSTAIQRDKEEELIFRGLQYAEAIRVFQARNGRLPVSLEELIEIEPRALRQLWTDPMTEDGAWGVIYATAPGQGQRGGSAPGQVGGALDSSQPILNTSGSAQIGVSAFGDDDDDEDDLDDDSSDSGFGSSGSFGLSRREQRLRRRVGLGGTLGGGPIVGVHSLSEEEALKSFEGGSKYNEWKFTADLLPSGGPTGENVPRLNADFVGRPLPQGVEAPGDGVEDGQGGPILERESPEERRERRRRERQERREQRRRERQGGGGGAGD